MLHAACHPKSRDPAKWQFPFGFLLKITLKGSLVLTRTHPSVRKCLDKKRCLHHVIATLCLHASRSPMTCPSPAQTNPKNPKPIFLSHPKQLLNRPPNPRRTLQNNTSTKARLRQNTTSGDDLQAPPYANCLSLPLLSNIYIYIYIYIYTSIYIYIYGSGLVAPPNPIVMVPPNPPVGVVPPPPCGYGSPSPPLIMVPPLPLCGVGCWFGGQVRLR